ncbi:hypothetical protein KCU68_g14917, partial [Aureobasidium melanogenum]
MSAEGRGRLAGKNAVITGAAGIGREHILPLSYNPTIIKTSDIESAYTNANQRSVLCIKTSTIRDMIVLTQQHQ